MDSVRYLKEFYFKCVYLADVTVFSDDNNCSMLLTNKDTKSKMNKRISDIVASERRLLEIMKDLETFLNTQMITYNDAKDSRSLFQIYLENSDNKLLIKLMEDGSHLGRGAKTSTSDAF